MKKKNYLAPQSDMIDVDIEISVCFTGGGAIGSNVSNPFSNDAVPDEEEEW